MGREENGGAGRAGFCEARNFPCLFQYCIPMAKHSICTERLLKVQLLDGWMNEGEGTWALEVA